MQAVVSVLSAVAAMAATLIAFLTMRENRRMVFAQVILQVTRDYASSEMLKGAKSLNQFRSKYGKRYAAVFAKGVKEGRFIKEDNARRLFSHHFHQLRLLLDTGVLPKRFVRRIPSKYQVNYLLEMVEPLEKALNPKYNPSTFKVFRGMLSKLRA